MTQNEEAAALVAILDLEADPKRRAAIVAAFRDIADEIAKLRTLDLTDIHPAVVFDAHLTINAAKRS